MRRHARRLFMLCSTVSLVLLISTAAAPAVLAREYRWQTPTRSRTLRVDGGRFLWEDWPAPQTARGKYARQVWQAPGVQCYWWTHPADPVVSVYISISRQSLVLVTAALPLAWTAVHVLRRSAAVLRKRRGLCHVCGYDLRASPGRCPECGAVPEVTM